MRDGPDLGGVTLDRDGRIAEHQSDIRDANRAREVDVSPGEVVEQIAQRLDPHLSKLGGHAGADAAQDGHGLV